MLKIDDSPMKSLPLSSAAYVDENLMGAKPSDLSITQPINVEFFITRKTAPTRGLTIQRSKLMLADKVTENKCERQQWSELKGWYGSRAPSQNFRKQTLKSEALITSSSNGQRPEWPINSHSVFVHECRLSRVARTLCAATCLARQ